MSKKLLCRYIGEDQWTRLVWRAEYGKWKRYCTTLRVYLRRANHYTGSNDSMSSQTHHNQHAVCCTRCPPGPRPVEKPVSRTAAAPRVNAHFFLLFSAQYGQGCSESPGSSARVVSAALFVIQEGAAKCGTGSRKASVSRFELKASVFNTSVPFPSRDIHIL